MRNFYFYYVHILCNQAEININKSNPSLCIHCILYRFLLYSKTHGLRNDPEFSDLI